MKFKINQPALDKVLGEATANLQQSLDRELQRIVREVRDEMQGQPADEILPVLIRRLTTEIPGLKPNEPELRVVAEEIEAGTLTD